MAAGGLLTVSTRAAGAGCAKGVGGNTDAAPGTGAESAKVGAEYTVGAALNGGGTSAGRSSRCISRSLERALSASTDTPLALIGTAHFVISLLTKRLR